MSKTMNKVNHDIWVFGDYRNYFQNRVTLQLLAQAVELAPNINAEVCAVVFGNDIDEYIGEYIAHGAHKVYAIDDPTLEDYNVETYVNLMERMIEKHKPEVVLVGATSFGRYLRLSFKSLNLCKRSGCSYSHLILQSPN